MESSYKRIINAVPDGIKFLKEQPGDWKVTATRTSIFRLFYQMVLPYLSIYTIGLGATGTQLGIVNSVGMAASGLMYPFTGRILDRIGPKKIYLAGIALLSVSWFVYGIAQSWTIIIIAMLAYWIGFSTSMHSCAVICGNSLSMKNRATAMSCCESLAAGFLGVVGPIIGMWLVNIFGGVSVNGIRPLFFVSLAGSIGTFLLILMKLSDRKWISTDEVKINFKKDLSTVLTQGHKLKRFIVISIMAHIPMGMIIPFTQPFAHEVKGADEFILGAMVVGFGLTPLIFGIPAGRLADRIGRKKVIYLVSFFLYASSIILVWAPSQPFLIVAGILQGAHFIILVITAAMQFELVPAEHMGRWLGILGLGRMVVMAISAYMAGFIWDNLGPQYVFLIYVLLDLLIRIPLLIGMPETLGPRNGIK